MADAVLHLSIPVRDLDAARKFYERVLGCRVGRVRDDWLDVWFFGMQITLQQRPEQVVPLAEAGIRHFGVTLGDRESFTDLVDRIAAHGVRWLEAPATAAGEELSGKVGGKLADPSGNVIEIKYYEDLQALQHDQ